MKRVVPFTLTVALAMVAACSPAPTPAPTAALSTAAPTAVPTSAAYVPKPGELGSADTPIVIAFIPAADTAYMTKVGQGISDSLAKETGWAYKFLIGTSEAASIEALGGNKAQVGFLNTFPILLAKAKYDIDVQLVSQHIYLTIPIDPDKDLNGTLTSFYKSQFIARKESGIKTYADLKGKRFWFVTPTSASGNIVPRITLKANGIDPDKDFTSSFAGGHDKTAIAVYRGDCDAGVTFVDILTNAQFKLYEIFPDLSVKVTQFAISDRIPNDGVQFVKGLDLRVRDATVKAFLKMAADPAGKQVLKDLGIDAFEQAGYDKYYKPFDDLLKKAGVDAAAMVK